MTASPASASPAPPPGAAVLAATRVAAHLRGEVERTVLEPAGVSWSAFAALTAIADGPHEVRMHVVAAAMGTALGTARSAVARLERLGLVSRSTPSHDHRQVELIATEPGRQRAEQLRTAVAAVEARLIPDPRTRHVLCVVADRVWPYPWRGHRQDRGA
ncbi:MarR family winged helix-turn-helix transcriptional regulator [Dactylosporangium darangshiense]|uniref:MarR family winged helix-turn-helix transcriptional regulator n=1 Tax=Dactylosporangium darangshiense TaxID=579108 RepID=UPI0031F1B232